MGDSEDVVLSERQKVRALELTIAALTNDLEEALARAEAAEMRSAALEMSTERSAMDRCQAENRRLRKAMRAIRALTEERGEGA